MTLFLTCAFLFLASWKKTSVIFFILAEIAFSKAYGTSDFVKKIMIRSRDLWRHKRNSLRPVFRLNRVFSHVTCCHWLKWRHYAWFRSDDYIWPLTLHVDLEKIIRGHWPWLIPYLLMGLFFGGGLRFWIRFFDSFFIDVFIGFLYRFRCQSHPLTQLAIGPFFRWGWHCSLTGCDMSQIFDQDTKTMRNSVRNWTENTLVKVFSNR